MNTTITPFAEALAHASGLLQATIDRDVLRSQYDHWSGILRGYFLGGAVSRIEAEAASEQLRKLYVARFDATAPDIRRDEKPNAVETRHPSVIFEELFRRDRARAHGGLAKS